MSENRSSVGKGLQTVCDESKNGYTIAVVGPFPPPPGGMSNQAEALAKALAGEGINVLRVATNRPDTPAWIGRVRFARALFRLVPYLGRLWNAAAKADIFHVLANSGWSWHLFAAPAVGIGRLRGVSVVLNYRGGDAERFLRRTLMPVCSTIRLSQRVIVPSGYLKEVFVRRGIESEVVPNILERPQPAANADSGRTERQGRRGRPCIVITRALEEIYGIDTALRAFALILPTLPDAMLRVAGGGADRNILESLAQQLGVSEAVEFLGSLAHDEVRNLIRDADIMLNPCRVDNSPNSILEALGAGVPVVSSDAGGIPYMVEDGITALLVPVGAADRMADAVMRLSADNALADRLRNNGLDLAEKYRWPAVWKVLRPIYRSVPLLARARRGPAAQ